jgi:hypothetical protein
MDIEVEEKRNEKQINDDWKIYNDMKLTNKFVGPTTKIDKIIFAAHGGMERSQITGKVEDKDIIEFPFNKIIYYVPKETCIKGRPTDILFPEKICSETIKSDISPKLKEYVDNKPVIKTYNMVFDVNNKKGLIEPNLDNTYSNLWIADFFGLYICEKGKLPTKIMFWDDILRIIKERGRKIDMRSLFIIIQESINSYFGKKIDYYEDIDLHLFCCRGICTDVDPTWKKVTKVPIISNVTGGNNSSEEDARVVDEDELFKYLSVCERPLMKTNKINKINGGRSLKKRSKQTNKKIKKNKHYRRKVKKTRKIRNIRK